MYSFQYKTITAVSIISFRCLSNCGTKVSPQDELLLEAYCHGEACSKVSKYTWSFLSLDQSVNKLSVSEVHNIKIYPQMNSRRLLIKDIFRLQDDTKKHINYAVKAEVKLDNGIEFYGNYSFVVNSPPKRAPADARCHVAPMEGEAISTDFSITCLGWQDADQPLTYEFRYRGKYGLVIIQTGSLDKVTTKLPVGDAAEDYALVLEAMVGDSFKDFTTTRLLVMVRITCVL